MTDFNSFAWSDSVWLESKRANYNFNDILRTDYTLVFWRTYALDWLYLDINLDVRNRRFGCNFAGETYLLY